MPGAVHRSKTKNMRGTKQMKTRYVGTLLVIAASLFLTTQGLHAADLSAAKRALDQRYGEPLAKDRVGKGQTLYLYRTERYAIFVNVDDNSGRVTWRRF